MHSFNPRPPRRDSTTTSRPYDSRRPNGFRRDFIRHDDTPPRNDPVVHTKEPKAPPKPVLTETDLFKEQRIGSFTIRFQTDGEPIKAKKSHGYLMLKPRGGSTMTGYFLLTSESTLPARKTLIREIETFYSRSSDYKFHQLHLDATVG